MTDAELIARLREGATWDDDIAAADRIEALIAERDQHWDSFVHWRKEADDRSEQLAAAREDAKEAETYAEELEQERNEAIRRRDAWKSKAEGYDAVRKALREKVGAPWPPNLSRALWAGIAADEKKRADDAEAKLAKAVEALDGVMVGGNHLATILPDSFPTAETEPLIALETMGYGYDFEVWCCWRSIMLARATLAELKGESHD